MSHFLKNITFHGILLDSLFDDDNSEFRAINQFITKGMQAGFVKPLKATVFNKNDVEEAFRYMAKGKHMGKILIKVNHSFISVIFNHYFSVYFLNINSLQRFCFFAFCINSKQ